MYSAFLLPHFHAWCHNSMLQPSLQTNPTTLLLSISICAPKIPVELVSASPSITWILGQSLLACSKLTCFFHCCGSAVSPPHAVPYGEAWPCSGRGRNRAEIQVWITSIPVLHPQGLRVDAALLRWHKDVGKNGEGEQRETWARREAKEEEADSPRWYDLQPFLKRLI